MRKKNDALGGRLLEAARSIADADGIDAINIRSIAARVGVASGTVYNYFSNKEEILLALTEEYWRQTLFELEAAVGPGPFCQQLQEIFAFLKARMEESGGKLMNSLGKAEAEGQVRMASMQAALSAALAERLEQDETIPGTIWTEGFSKEEFAHFLMMNMMLLLKTGAPDMSFLLQIVRRTIY